MDWELSAKAKKDIINLDSLIQKRILTALDNLSLNPFSKDTKQLKGNLLGRYRLRVGDYRVVYTINDGKIAVSDIAHRREVYR